MPIKQLTLYDFRNILRADANFASNFNLLDGENGAGKTNFLEAIYYLGTGRSFRCNTLPRMIRYSTDKFTICGKVIQNSIDTTIGLERQHNGEQKIHINGEKINSIAELARLVPLQLLYQDSYQLLVGGPKYRRQFMDWGVFHVEHIATSLWTKINKLLLQRNAALKTNHSLDQIGFWDQELAKISLELHNLRQAYLTKLLPLAQDFFELLLNFTIKIDYYAGWDTEQELLTILSANLARDQQQGFTQCGPQRADLQFRIDKNPVRDVLSRGQQKLFLLALYLAQGTLLNQATGKQCIFLIDDLTAELDASKQKLAIKTLTQLDAQVFISGIELQNLAKTLASQDLRAIKMFHVKHGEISECVL